MEKFSNQIMFSHVLARKRLFFCVAVAFTIIIGLSLIDTEQIAGSWTSRPWSNPSTTPPPKHSSGSDFGLRPANDVKWPRAYKRPGYEAPLANGVPLRIMGLGASTVFGQESFDMTGWRRTLRQHLVAVGNPVNMVGSQRIGEMVDNDVEAYPGARIDIVYDHATQVVSQMKPNLAIVYAGSNDNFQNASLPELYKRFYALVDYVLTESPRSTVIMGTLMPTTETQLWGGQDRVGGCNEQLRRLYEILKREGKPVVLTEMDDEWGVQIENLGWDHMHPTRAGYEIMSRKFFEAIIEADARGFLQAPEPVEGIVDDGELERHDDAFRAKLAEEKMRKDEHDRIEEEAIQSMIEELRTNPWDGKPAVDEPVLPIPDRPENQNQQ